MTTITHHLTARCSPDRLWSVLAELTAVERYNPTVRAARIVGERAQGVGTIRECDLRPKGRLRERVTHWEEGQALGLEVAASDWPVTYMRWITRLSPDGSGSAIDQQLDYGMKFGPLGWLLNHLVMRRTIRRNVGATLKKLVEVAEAA